MNRWTTLVRERLTQVSGAPADDGLVEELASHLAQAFEDAKAEGMNEADAHAAALRLLDADDPLREALRARRPRPATRVAGWARQEPAGTEDGGGLMSSMNVLADARHALRLLLRAPGFSIIAILTFAVGIGVTTAVFTVVNAVLLRPLPYPESERITMVWLDNERQGIREDITSYPNYRDWRDLNTSYSALAAFRTRAYTLTGAGEPERIMGASVTASFFDVLGLPPLVGRTFTDAAEVPGEDDVVVLSHGLWQRRFGGAPDALGQSLLLTGRPYTVIGVMPPAMQLPERAELWTPLAPDDPQREARGSFWLPVIGRLAPGVTVEQAQTEMSRLSGQIAEEYEFMRGFGAYVVSLHRQTVGDVERTLLVLMAAVGFVLLIACANLANLLFGRTAARRKELAVRSALGAGRGRLIRQIVTEALVLAMVGGVLGVLLAHWVTTVAVSLGEGAIPRGDAVRLDVRVLAFACGAATLAALLAGLLPAWQASRAASGADLREGARQGAGSASHRTRTALVGIEVALAFILLTGAGLLTRTLWSMQDVDRGFITEHVATMTVSAPATSYPEPTDVHAFYARLLGAVRATPGVEAAATTSGVLMPLLANSTVFGIEGRPFPPAEERVEYPFEIVSDGFFETLGISFIAGRSLTVQDAVDAPRAVVINETLARHAWPGQDPIDRRLRPGGPDSQAPWMTVVGVIRDIHRADGMRAVRPELYMSSQQFTSRTQQVLVRTSGDPMAIVPTVRAHVQTIDPELAVYAVSSLDQELGRTLARPRFQALLLGAFALVALLLATIGIYGVTSHAVQQRTQEVGIRMALGANRGSVLGLILRQSLAPALVGVLAGIGGALLLGRFLQSLLYGVDATDPATLVMMAALLLLVALIACWIPAHRAARVDPLSAVRAE